MSEQVAALIAGAGLCASAAAQLPSFAYEIHAPATMTPGQTATITVLCGFSPGVGGLVMTTIGLRPVLGLSSGSFDVAASGGEWVLGMPPSGALIFPYNFIGTTQGTASGGSVTGVLWGNGFPPPFGVVSTVNPTPIWNATFTAPATGPVSISVVPVGPHGVWVDQPNIPVEVLSWSTTGAQVIIHVIPTPASLALLAAGLFTAAQRRRSRP